MGNLAAAAVSVYIRSEFSTRSIILRYSDHIKPISYLKANAAKVLRDLAETREPYVITQNGEAKAVIQDVATYEQTQETLALFKILALGQRDIEAGRTKPLREVVERLRRSLPDK
jgi:prevent-host-death family protein